MRKKTWNDYLWIWTIIYFALGFFNILFALLGGKLKCSRGNPTPKWLISKWFRYGFLIFFLIMFGNMIFQTWLVGSGVQSLREVVKLFWTFKVPWDWAYTVGNIPDWIAQFSFGFYSIMLTSTLIGLIVMVLYKPRSWCVFCPHGNHDTRYLSDKSKKFSSLI